MALIKPRPRLRGGGVQTRHPHTCLGNLVGLMLGKSSEESHSERLPYSCQVCQFYQRVYQVVSTPQDSSRGENRDDACTKIPLYACIYIHTQVPSQTTRCGVRGNALGGSWQTWVWTSVHHHAFIRGTIVNRTYGTHKNLCTHLFLLTIFGPVYFGPP